MSNDLSSWRQEFAEALKKIDSLPELRLLEIKYLGKKGLLTARLRGLSELDEKLRRSMGQDVNAFKQQAVTTIAQVREKLLRQASASAIDVTLPGQPPRQGHLHLVTLAMNEIVRIFERLGFYRVSFPEVEWDWYAFGGLNMPADHPARDEWETFFVSETNGSGIAQGSGRFGKQLLTPHTSSGQVREMELRRPPIRMINISKCYRRQIDASHVPMFHQFEGLLVDTAVTVPQLIGTLRYFSSAFFGPDRRIRLRPYHFQFTEPSFEIDITCGLCGGLGCRLCKAGWLELGGAGMVHPNVLRAGRIDPKKYSGYAFGWGVERTYLMKAGLQIPDIRILYQNDLRFLQQF